MDETQQQETVQVESAPEATLEQVDLSMQQLGQELQKSEVVIETLLDDGEADMLLESLNDLDI